MDANREARIAAIASCQCSVFSRSQALGVGFTDDAIKRRLRSGRWIQVRPGVYALPGVAESWPRELWVGLLAVGPLAVVTHESAAALRTFYGFFPGPVVLTIPHGGHARLPGAFVHQITDLRPHHVEAIDGMPVSSPARVVAELASVVGAKRLADLLDDLVTHRRLTDAKVAAVLSELSPRKPGFVRLARLLDDRGPGYVPPASELERAFFTALDSGGLPAPTRQLALPGRGAIEGLVDAGYSDVRLLMETDGRRWHTRIKDIARDHERDAEAARAGWQTLRFLYEHVMDDPAEVCATIRDVRAARAGLSPKVRQ